MVKFDRSAFISKFREEADDHLQNLNEGVIRLESSPDDPEIINEMLRSAHTLKGASNMVGLLDVSEIAHRMEDIMVLIRDGRMAFSPKLSEPFFEALDAIVYLSDQAVKGEEPDYDVQSLLALLGAIAEQGAKEEPGEPEPVVPTDRGAAGKAGRKAAKAARAAGPPRAVEQPGEAQSGGGAEAAGESEEEGKKELPKQAPKLSAATIRVRTEQVDRILNLVGEMVIAQIKAEDRVLAAKELSEAASALLDAWMPLKADTAVLGDGDGLPVDEVNELIHRLRDKAKDYAGDYADDTARMSAVVEDLQEAGMQMRMLPAATVFNAFPRAVHDMARAFNKEIDLEIEGAETELDKKILEEINDPLIHIVRNAVDHGIEPPEEREAAGKPRKGTIRLCARQEGDQIQIIVEDDGRGIDPQRVRESAVRKGFLTEAEARGMSDQEAQYLIFETGFSTSQIITEVSGRGVGLDVVRQFISEKLKGSFDVESEVGQGTRMTLTLPLTLAIIRALLIVAGGQKFALPTTTVEETHKVDADSVKKVEGREAIWLRSRSVPIVRLDRVLGIPQVAVEEDGSLSMVIVSVSGQRMGFVVDELLGEQQIVIKTLGSHLRQVDNVAGATILGAGEVVLILHAPDLVASARALSGMRVPGRRPEERVEGGRRVLIVEDSFTTRELERSIFEASGYEVATATDGDEALGMVKAQDFDVVVTDVQMPNMDGFELTRRIKDDERLARIPVVIVTSLEREEEKRKGIDAGADAYITKSVFNQETLLDTVERLIG